MCDTYIYIYKGKKFKQLFNFFCVYFFVLTKTSVPHFGDVKLLFTVYDLNAEKS